MKKTYEKPMVNAKVIRAASDGACGKALSQGCGKLVAKTS